MSETLWRSISTQISDKNFMDHMSFKWFKSITCSLPGCRLLMLALVRWLSKPPTLPIPGCCPLSEGCALSSSGQAWFWNHAWPNLPGWRPPRQWSRHPLSQPGPWTGRLFPTWFFFGRPCVDWLGHASQLVQKFRPWQIFNIRRQDGERQAGRQDRRQE